MSPFLLIMSVFIIVLIIGIIGFIVFLKLRNAANPVRLTAMRNYMKNGNYRNVIKLAREIIGKDPRSSEAHYLLAIAYEKDGRDELALEEYRSVDKLGIFSKNINEYDLRTHLADLYAKFNKVDEALKECALLAQKNTNDYELFFRMGELFNAKGNKQQAAAYYLKTLQLKKKFPPAVYNLGMIYFECKKYLDAKKLFSVMKAENPENWKVYYYLGIIEKNEGDYKNALASLEKATHDKEIKVKALAERGLTYSAIGKHELASFEFERALNNLNGESQNFVLNVRYFLAGTYEALRDINNAVKQWEMIYSIKPDFRNVGEKLAVFQNLRMDDTMKDYMTAANEDFFKMCKSIAASRGLNVEELHELGNSGECVELTVSENNTGWINLKKKQKIMRIYRKSDPVDERQMREVVDLVKARDFFKGIIISSGGFSERAIAFSQERPLELIDKNELQKILKSINV